MIRMFDTGTYHVRLDKVSSLAIIAPNPGPVLAWPMQDGLLPLLIFYRKGGGGLVLGKPDVTVVVL